MKHWKFRAAAMIVIIAALLTGTLSLVNDEADNRGAPSALLRLITAFTGDKPAQGDPAVPGPGGEVPNASATAPAVTAAPTAAAILPVGSVDISISGSDGGSPGESTPTNVSPNQRIPKDYHVDNKGSADVYVFISVTVPYVNVATQKEDGTYLAPASRPLYSFQANPGWTLLEDQVSNERATYVYAYAPDSAGSMTVLSPGQSTGRLFDELVTLNYVEGKLDGTEREVVAQAYAIQARNLGDDTDTPAAVWTLVKNGEASRDVLQ